MDLPSKAAKDRIDALICMPYSYLERMQKHYQMERATTALEVSYSRATVTVTANTYSIRCEDTEEMGKLVEEATRDYEFILKAISHLMKYRASPLGKEMESTRRTLRGTIRTVPREMVPWDKILAHDTMECEMVWKVLMEKMRGRM